MRIVGNAGEGILFVQMTRAELAMIAGLKIKEGSVDNRAFDIGKEYDVLQRYHDFQQITKLPNEIKRLKNIVDAIYRIADDPVFNKAEEVIGQKVIAPERISIPAM